VSRRKNSIPQYRLHKSSGQAVCYVGRKEVYLGKFDSPESRQKYAELIANLNRPVEDAPKAAALVSVNEVALFFATHKAGLLKYLNRDGSASAEQDCYKGVLKILRELFGESPAVEFGPLALRICRDAMVERAWARSHINKQCQRLRRVFKFAAGWEIIPGSIVQNLKTVEPLMPGDSQARET